MTSYVATGLNYKFTPGGAGAGTVNFQGNPGFSFIAVKAITDQNQNAFIYLPGVAGFGGTWDSTGTILTLGASTTGFASTDTLLIQYDDQANSLLDIASTLQGTVQADMPIPSTPLGAVMRSPNLQDGLRSLMGEVRVLTLVFCQLAREDIDLDALKRSVLDQMQS